MAIGKSVQGHLALVKVNQHFLESKFKEQRPKLAQPLLKKRKKKVRNKAKSMWKT